MTVSGPIRQNVVAETTIAIVFAAVAVVFGVVKLGLLGAGLWKLDEVLAAAGVETGDDYASADEDPWRRCVTAMPAGNSSKTSSCAS